MRCFRRHGLPCYGLPCWSAVMVCRAGLPCWSPVVVCPASVVCYALVVCRACLPCCCGLLCSVKAPRRVQTATSLEFERPCFAPWFKRPRRRNSNGRALVQPATFGSNGHGVVILTPRFAPRLKRPRRAARHGSNGQASVKARLKRHARFKRPGLGWGAAPGSNGHVATIRTAVLVCHFRLS